MADLSIQEQIKAGTISDQLKLEFYVWTGAAYAWTDYTDRLLAVGSINMQVEQDGRFGSFGIDLNEIRLSNADGLFADIDTLDGLLANTSEPYGRKLFKRKVRLSMMIRGADGTLVAHPIFTGIVRDVTLAEGSNEAVVRVMSMAAIAADQRLDSDTVNRHPLGSTDSAAPSNWTTTMPAVTGTVAFYRWREKDAADGEYSIASFRDRRLFDVVKHTSWAMDDLNAANDMSAYIEEQRLYSSDAREIASSINVPPDDSSVSTGPGTMRCRAVVWNPQRNVLVCAVGNQLYDYDPAANTYTLRHTASAGNYIHRLWYIERADSGAHTYRLVLLEYDHTTYSGRATVAYVRVLDATGSGDYSTLCNETLLPTFFPGTHTFREGAVNGNWTLVGQSAAASAGENIHVIGNSLVNLQIGGAEKYANHADGILTNWAGDPIPLMPYGEHLERDYYCVATTVWGTANIGVKYAWGALRVAAAINLYDAGGTLVFCEYDATNKYRLRKFSLYDYTLGAHIDPFGSSNLWVPQFLHCADYGESDHQYVMMSAMDWKDNATDYSASHLCSYDISSPGWVDVAWRNGASGTDRCWTVMEICKHTGHGGSWPFIMFNRATQEWAIVYSPSYSWALTSEKIVRRGYSRMQGLHENRNYSPDKIFWVECADNGFKLFAYDGTTVTECNPAQSGLTVGQGITADCSIGMNLTHTQANYPDTSTPNGVTFGISANDLPDLNAGIVPGEYVLWQYANYSAGFIKLLDCSDLSIHDLRSLLAEMIGYVQYYDGSGNFCFRDRVRTAGAPSFTLSAANRNYVSAQITSQRWEDVITNVSIIPKRFTSSIQAGDIIASYGSRGRATRRQMVNIPTINRRIAKGESGGQSTGLLLDVRISAAVSGKEQWRLVFTSRTAYDLYKLVGSVWVVKVPSASITTALRGSAIPDGKYLDFFPEYFSGTFYTGDTFTFSAYPAEDALQDGDSRDKIELSDATAILNYQRAVAEFDNRFVTRDCAVDYLSRILAYCKSPHANVEVLAMSDPGFMPILTMRLISPELGYDIGDEFLIAQVGMDIGNGLTKLTLKKM
jgi:hypothetical protein